jgi:TolB-like protein/DNA-binding winged helix-turn-helix (wHTH) protein
MIAETTKRFRLGDWLVDPMLDEISRDGVVVKLEPRAVRLLLCLARQPGKVCSVQELLDEGWSGVIVSSQSVYQAVAMLRRLLGDNALKPSYIASVPRRGYRLVAPVLPVDTTPTANDLALTALLPNPAGDLADVREPAPGPPVEQAQRFLSRRLRSSVVVLGAALTGLVLIVLTLTGGLATPKMAGARIGATTTTRPGAPEPSEQRPAIPVGPTIVVLPFINVSGDPGQQYLAEGLTEEVTGHLESIRGLRVVSRTHFSRGNSNPEDVGSIAKRLNVTHILDGSVRESADGLRILTHLIAADSGEIIQSGVYDIKLGDLFQTQDKIATATVRSLRPEFTPPPVLTAHYSSNGEAYRQYLLGRKFSSRMNPEGWRLAVVAYRRAIELDPHYAAAYAAIADPEGNLWDQTGDDAWLQRAIADANQAVALGPDHPDSYVARATVRHWYEFDWVGAKNDFEKALALQASGGDGTAESDYGKLLASLGQLSSAIAAQRKAIEIEPLSHDAWFHLGMYLIADHQYGLADQALHTAIDIEPDASYGWGSVGTLQLLEGKPGLALTSFNRLRFEVLRLRGVAMAEYSLGHASASKQAVDALIAHHADVDAYQIAQVYAWCGENDAAFSWLHRAYRQHDGGLGHLKYDPLLEHVRADPRFGELLREMNLPI